MFRKLVNVRGIYILAAMMLSGVVSAAMIENDAVKVTVCEKTGLFTLVDKANRWTWEACTDGVKTRTVKDCAVRDGKIVLTAPSDFTFTWELAGREVVCTLSAPTNTPHARPTLEYPYPIKARADERFLLPQGPGYAYPADFKDAFGLPSKFRSYSCNYKMGIWAQYAETELPSGEIRPSVGYAAIVETPEDLVFNFALRGNQLRAMNVAWDGEKGCWGYDRRVRYVFFKETSLKNVAARYRADMIAKGYLVTLRDKQAARPHMKARYADLVGAPNVWYWGTGKVPVTRRLKQLGFENFIMNCAGGAEAFWQLRSTAAEVQGIAAFDRVLVGCYDIFKDTITPALTNEVRFVSTDWDLTAETKGDLEMSAPSVYSRGWRVANKDPQKPFVSTYTICPGRIIDYARAKMTRLLKDHPFDARLLDVTGCGLSVCYSPRHPLTRRTSLSAKQAFFNMFRDEFGQLAATEEGMECFVPCCDYFEAMMTGPNEWRMDGGRYMWKTYPKEPAKVAFGMRPDLRVPFWEMVFHECAVSYWYWTDHNNKYADMWWKRDLYNVLYATPPMYLFERREFMRIQDELARSVKRATLTAKAAGWDQMMDFRILSRDRTVQQTSFANGVTATVNFGDRDFTLADGMVIPARDFRVTGIPMCSPKVETWLVADEDGKAAELAKKHLPTHVKVIPVDLGKTRIAAWTPRSGIVSVNALMDVREWRVRKDFTEKDINAENFVFTREDQPTILWQEKLSKFVGEKVDGVLWRQGSADAPDWRRFADRLHALENGLRTEFKNPALNFIAVPIEPDVHIRTETQVFTREQNTF